MADNTQLNSGSGGDTIATDDVGGIKHQRVKIQYGTDGVATDVNDTNPLPIDDAGGSLTVDNAALSVTGGGVEASALRVTLANDSTGVVSVDDGGGSLTVDGAVTANAGTGTFTIQEAAAMDVSAATVTVDLGANNDVINTGTFAVQEDGAALTALQVLDNVVIVDDAAYTPGTTSVSMCGFTFDDTAPDSIDEGDAGAARMSANRNIYTTLRDAAGNERGANINASNQLEINIGAQTADVTIADGGNTITVDGTVTANLGAADNAVLDQIEVNTSYGDNTGAGTEANSLRVTIANDSTGLLSVDDNGGSLTVDNGGTFATQATLQSNSGVDIGDVDVLTCGTITPGTAGTSLGKAQDTAVGATDTGIAMLAQRDDEQSAVTPVDGDYVVPRCDKFGNLKVTNLPDATSEVKYAIIDAASSGDNTLQAAAGAGVKIRVLSVIMISAGTVAARFESGAAGTALTGQMNLVANSGFTLPYNPAGWFETADNTLLNLELSGAISVDGCLTYVEV